MINAPYVTGPMGKRWVDESDPLYQGVYGFGGHDSARELFRNNDIDLILAIGAALGEMGTGGWNTDILNNKLIHIDSSFESFSRSPMARLHVCGHLDVIFSRLIESVQEARKWGREWQGIKIESSKNKLGSFISINNIDECFSNQTPIKPQRLMAFLNEKFDVRTRLYVDTGNAWAWATHYILGTTGNGTYRVSMGYGTMAWAIGASIGAAFANPEVPHVCLTGDGSYLMSGQEITVAAQYNLPVIIIVLNDAALGMIKHGQQLSDAESIGWDLNNINYADMVKAMGIDGFRVDTPEQLDALDMEAILNKKSPTLIDVRIDPDEMPPMLSRVKSLQDDGATGYK